jgi:hypothetical protein
MNRIKAFVLSFIVLAGASAYAATRSQAGTQDPSSCCVSSCCEVGAACCPVQASQE